MLLNTIYTFEDTHTKYVREAPLSKLTRGTLRPRLLRER